MYSEGDCIRAFSMYVIIIFLISKKQQFNHCNIRPLEADSLGAMKEKNMTLGSHAALLEF